MYHRRYSKRVPSGFGGLTLLQICFTNSTEVLFAAVSLYNLRVIERLWGSRKFAVRTALLPASRPAELLISTAVLPPRNPPLHDPPPSAHPYLHPPPTDLRSPQFPPCRPNSDHFRPPRQLLRRDTLHLPLQDLTVLVRTARCIVLILIVECCANSYKHLG